MTVGTTAASSVDPVILSAQVAPTRVELRVLVPESLLYLKGHFPGLAILPGVVQIDWAVRLARRYLAVPDEPAEVVQVKFRKPVRARAELALTLTLAPDRHRLLFEWHNGTDIFSSGQVGFWQS